MVGIVTNSTFSQLVVQVNLQDHNFRTFRSVEHKDFSFMFS